MGLVVRTTGNPLGLVAAIKSAVWGVDPAQPLANIVTIDRSWPRRWGAAWSSLRAVLAGAAAGGVGSALAGAGLAALLPEVRNAGRSFGAIAGGALVAIGAFAAARGATTGDPVRAPVD